MKQEEYRQRPLTCEGCIYFRDTCSRVTIDAPCFQYRDEDDEALEEQEEKK